MLIYALLLSCPVFLGGVWFWKRARTRERLLLADFQHHSARILARSTRLAEEADACGRLAEAKSRAVASIVGEMRTPLMLLVDPLKRGVDDLGALEAEQRIQARALLRSAHQLEHLVEQLEDVLHFEVGAPRIVRTRSDLVAFLEHLVLSLEPLAERKGVALRFETGPEHLPVAFDRRKLRRAFQSLIERAVEATPEEGVVRVRLAAQGDDRVVVEVWDGAEALPERHRQLLAGDDHWAVHHDPDYPAQSLGLALARSFITLHGGRLSVVEGAGSPGIGVRIDLPVRHDALAEDVPAESGDSMPKLDLGADEDGPVFTLVPNTRAASHAAADGQAEEGADVETGAETNGRADEKTTVLIVDDHPGIRGYLSYALRKRHRVLEAANGREALRLVRDEKPDLVLSDVIMPVMDGYALCRAVKEDADLNDIPVILVSARDVESARSFEAGADDYLAKPFDLDEALLRIDNMIKVRRQLRQRFSREVVLKPRDIAINSADEAFIERLRDIIEENMADTDFGVQELAAELGLSPRQLQRRLRELVDQSPVEFIRTLRLQRASQLLEHQAGTVSEIAYSVGFASLSYFAKCFRELYGVPPSEFASDRA